MSYVSFFLFDGSLLCFDCLGWILFLITQDTAVLLYSIWASTVCILECTMYITNCVFVRIQEPFLCVYQGCICQECQSRKDSLSTWSHRCHRYTAYLCIKLIRIVVHCKKSCKIWDFFILTASCVPSAWAAKYLKEFSRWSQNDRRKFQNM